MATVFKTFLNDDIATTRTLLHEAIPVHGGVLAGTYAEPSDPENSNVKNYPHKMFQSVYDYPFLRSSANHIFDLSVGLSANSLLISQDDPSVQKKRMIYNQFAQVLVGHDPNGDILLFDEDGNILEGGDKLNECYVVSIARLLNKDEVKKGSFYLTLDVGRIPESLLGAGAGGEGGEGGEGESAPAVSSRVRLTISDEGSQDDYRVNSPAGDYGILKCRTYEVVPVDENGEEGSPTCYVNYDDLPAELEGLDIRAGLIYYQAGVVILSPYIFSSYVSAGSAGEGEAGEGEAGEGEGEGESSQQWSGINGKLPGLYCSQSDPVMYEDDRGGRFMVDDAFLNLDIPQNCDGIRQRINRLAFNNTTELNSTIYFCRVNHNDFNYSSNPTYLDGSKIRVKESTIDAPVSYITTVGLYSADNELLAVAKLSEALRKDPTNELTLRVRLDY